MELRLLIAAQLSRQLCEILNSKGFNTLHVDELPSGDETTDPQIIS